MAFKGTCGAFWRALGKRRRDRFNEPIGEDQRRVVVLVNVPKPESVVAGLGQHPAFIRRENTSIVVVNKRANANTCRTAQVNVADGAVRKHPSENECRVEFPERRSRAIDLENASQASLVESKPFVDVVTVV